jgi:hypothetical protein
MSIKSAYLNKSAITKLNKRLVAAGYPAATGDTGPRSGAYAMNIINRLAGAEPNHRREVEDMIVEVLKTGR